jgi:Pyruvate/2-oxoacid:ferredoxin oxidoreductase delta subunit
VDVFRLRPPDFYLVDAVVGMQGNGPASTELRWIGRVLAADNAVALDGVISRMMGLDPAVLRMLTYAKGLGLGDFVPEASELHGPETTIADFKLPPLDGGAIHHAQALQDLLESRIVMRPWADPQRCTGCGTCVDQCPAQALSLVEAVAVVDAALCIGCFCCQEMCPEKAITLAAPKCPCSGGH